MSPNPTNYIEVKNNIKSYIIKYLKNDQMLIIIV